MIGVSGTELIPGYKHAFDPGWEQLPAGWRHLDVPDVAVDAKDFVFVLGRRDPRILVYDPAGTFVRSFGEGILSEKPHGIAVARSGLVYCADTPFDVVHVFDGSGDLIRTLGTKGAPSDSGFDPTISDPYLATESVRRPGGPFNQPAGVAIGLDDDVYVADGYGNACVHHFDAEGRLLGSWGAPGGGAGEFHLPHAVAVAPDGRVVVADRENDRLQVFTANGQWLATWPDLQRPAGVAVDQAGIVYVAELTRGATERSFVHGYPERPLTGCVAVLDAAGRLLGRYEGSGDPCAPDELADPHGIAVDSEGNIYVAEVSFTGLGRADCHTLQRLGRRD